MPAVRANVDNTASRHVFQEHAGDRRLIARTNSGRDHPIVPGHINGIPVKTDELRFETRLKKSTPAKLKGLQVSHDDRFQWRAYEIEVSDFLGIRFPAKQQAKAGKYIFSIGNLHSSN